MGTKLKRSTAYHPQSDGQTEVVNRCLETYLRCFTSERPRQWLKWLAWAEYWYNTTYHTALQNTPFKILYGRDPPHLAYHGQGQTASFEVDRYLEERDQTLKDLRVQLERAQKMMKDRADLHGRDVQFMVGDRVFLKLRPYRQGTVAQRHNQKLSSRYYGPFEVLERIGEVAYKLKLPETSRIHPVFHVSQLKKVVGSAAVEGQLPSDVGGDTEFVFQPESVKAIRSVKQGDQVVREVLICWSGLPDHEATWEPFDGIWLQFPDFHLEDKVKLLGGSNDKYGVQYTRRPRARDNDSASDQDQGPIPRSGANSISG